LPRRLERPHEPIPRDLCRDSARARLLAELAEDALELLAAHRVDEIGCRDGRRRIHAHVERPVALKGEAALGRIELAR
jgi:hypothetical protein